MRKKRNSEPFNIEAVTVTTDASPENNTPEKIEQRLDTLIKIAIEIANKRGLLSSGLLVEEVRQELGKQNSKPERAATWVADGIGDVQDVKTAELVQKEIRVRLSQEMWGQIGAEARKLCISPTELARRWLIEHLSRIT